MWNENSESLSTGSSRIINAAEREHRSSAACLRTNGPLLAGAKPSPFTVVTTLAEKGTPDWVIQAQVGHVDPQMMKTYSHIRRQALIAAAAALEPNPAPFPIESTHTQTH